jgi:hypothetical protein
MLIDLILINYTVTVATLVVLASGLWGMNRESSDRGIGLVILTALIPGANAVLLAHWTWALLSSLWGRTRTQR